jgi:hypothetical protein
MFHNSDSGERIVLSELGPCVYALGTDDLAALVGVQTTPQALKRALIFQRLAARVELVPFPF